MNGQGLLVELGLLDRPRRALDAEADEGGGCDGLAAHRAGLAVHVGVVVQHRRPAVPVAGEGQLHAGTQQFAQTFGVAGALVQHEARRVVIDPDQPEDRAPGHELAAEAAEMAGGEVRVAVAGHGVMIRPKFGIP